MSLDQLSALTHPTGGTLSPDELVTLATGAVTLIATVTDRDGDIASANIDLGGRVSFHDDAPTVTTNVTATSLVVDESTLGTNDTENFASAFTVDNRADGAGTTVYSLGVSSAGVDSGLDDVATGNSIYL